LPSLLLFWFWQSHSLWARVITNKHRLGLDTLNPFGEDGQVKVKDGFYRHHFLVPFETEKVVIPYRGLGCTRNTIISCVSVRFQGRQQICVLRKQSQILAKAYRVLTLHEPNPVLFLVRPHSSEDSLHKLGVGESNIAILTHKKRAVRRNLSQPFWMRVRAIMLATLTMVHPTNPCYQILETGLAINTSEAASDKRIPRFRGFVLGLFLHNDTHVIRHFKRIRCKPLIC